MGCGDAVGGREFLHAAAVVRLGRGSDERDGGREALGGGDGDGQDAGVGLLQQRGTGGFGTGLAFSPALEEGLLAGGEVGFSGAGEEFRYVDFFADGFEVDADWRCGTDGDHGPASGMGEIEFELVAGEGGFAMGAVGEDEVEGQGLQVAGEDDTESCVGSGPMFAVL